MIGMDVRSTSRTESVEVAINGVKGELGPDAPPGGGRGKRDRAHVADSESGGGINSLSEDENGFPPIWFQRNATAPYFFSAGEESVATGDRHRNFIGTDQRIVMQLGPELP